MPICMDCKKEVVENYHEIKTKRKTTVITCYECMKKYRRGNQENATDSR